MGGKALPDTAKQDDTSWLAATYRRTRQFSEQLCAPLLAEDMGLQACPETSPPRWHLAHTTWFFETFLLKPHLPGYRPHNPAFEYLFNSYYNGIGEQYPRPQRHLLSRPTNDEVMAWRHQVDAAIDTLLTQTDNLNGLMQLGINHEQQHQELLLTDLKYSLSFNPLSPRISRPINTTNQANESTPALTFQCFEGGLVDIGAHSGFAFDNETPRHKAWLEPFQLANRPVTQGEFRTFIQDGGYRNSDLWLSDGWSWVQQKGIERPLYWNAALSHHFTLAGEQPLADNQILAHVNYYEADAYARWAGKRLPTEQEWEHAARAQAIAGNFADEGLFQPGTVRNSALSHLFGDVWEWTASAYLPYPGFQAESGAVGEYNGKFMCNQMVLRGGSCASSASHLRASYRNFFYPHLRWQFSGIRLASDPRTKHA
ncbi:hypothetical protein Y017_12285 [Alcanivorax sp. 97CO-5]|uniref:ergothioneine biosynthesis protein EgtB n=1 Tax=unclassified Alcanivorax TaxID=2638842 RepID=UPI0003E7D772|nr:MULTISPECIES: ergothioneine biosynthesis protein EgtB [unclassified Alcanivorax]EUC70183.1 hypothetical protein Y017_12285 [Alcanivorax sp. 97CO-5]PKG01982.1 ergothioneine biosynthesis protein EgtB [Alcanivorax sp. 97CO-6]